MRIDFPRGAPQDEAAVEQVGLLGQTADEPPPGGIEDLRMRDLPLII
jgi:hypothetical protein